MLKLPSSWLVSVTGAVVVASLFRLNRHGSNPRLENQSLYDLFVGKLVLVSFVYLNCHQLTSNSQMRKSTKALPTGGWFW